jgi:hypothetical protein
LKESFRPNLFVRNIHQVVDRDPAYEYKNVIFTYKHDPARVSRYLDRGWEVVETTEHLSDDRDFSPKDTKEKLRPQPCITKTRDKHEQVLMRILATKRKENQLADKEARDNIQLRQSQQRGETTSRKGNEIITRGSELNIT